LFIITARENGELVGIAPFIKRQIKVFGLMNRTKLELIGTGEDEKDEVGSNYMDFMVVPGMEESFAREVASLLASVKNGFDEIALSSISENSSTINSFAELLKGQLINFKHKIIKYRPVFL
jgi:plasmid replication initiation protein